MQVSKPQFGHKNIVTYFNEKVTKYYPYYHISFIMNGHNVSYFII